MVVERSKHLNTQNSIEQQKEEQKDNHHGYTPAGPEGDWYVLNLNEPLETSDGNQQHTWGCNVPLLPLIVPQPPRETEELYVPAHHDSPAYQRGPAGQ